MTKYLYCESVKPTACIHAADTPSKIYFGCKPILEQKVKILCFQGFSAFNGCKPILTITEEREGRRETYTGVEYLCGQSYKKMPGNDAGERVLPDTDEWW